jgi:hypothetical protein
MLWEAITSGFVAGMAAAPHCAAMCGPLSAAACAARPSRAAPLRYQTGRVAGYLFAGSIAGQLGEVLAVRALPPLLLPLSVASVLLFAALRIWRPRRPALTTLGKPARSRALRALFRILPRDPLLLGALSALLPCGALAAALLLAAATADAHAGTLLMGGFALTSGAAVLASGWLLRRITGLQRPVLARALSVALLVAAALVLWRPVSAMHAEPGRTPHVVCH